MSLGDSLFGEGSCIHGCIASVSVGASEVAVKHFRDVLYILMYLCIYMYTAYRRWNDDR